MNDEWTQADQDRAVAQRREISALMQQATREGNHWAAWCYEKLADMILWVERQGRKLLRGWDD